MKRDITMIQRNRANRRDAVAAQRRSCGNEDCQRQAHQAADAQDRSVTLYLYEQAAVLESISSLSVTMMFRAGRKTVRTREARSARCRWRYTHSLEQEDGRVRIVYDVQRWALRVKALNWEMKGEST